MVSEGGIITHEHPALRERADFIVFAEIDRAGGEYEWEQLCARDLKDGGYELCCIPFFVYGLALGDVVSAASKRAKHFVVSGVIRQSAHTVFRAWLPRGGTAESRETLLQFLERAAVVCEWWSGNFVAIDCESPAEAQRVADFLQAQEELGALKYDTAR